MKWFERHDDVKPVELEPGEFRQVIDIAKGDYRRISEECEGKVLGVEKVWNERLDGVEGRWKAEYDKVCNDESVQVQRVRQALDEMKVKFRQYSDWLAKAPEAFSAQKEYIKQQCRVELDAVLHQKELAVGCLRQEYQDRLDVRKPIVDKMERAVQR